MVKGTLFVVATPIGNLNDITFRAVEVLKSVDVIFCENPDRHIKLLNHLGIRGKKLVRCSAGREEGCLPKVKSFLTSGKSIALVSDSGTPALSDPGGKIVETALEMGVRVVPVPGPSALISALSVSGFPLNNVFFKGFLPKKKGKRKKIFESVKSIADVFFSKDGLVFVFFHPARNLKSVFNEMLESLGGKHEVVVAREMTKVNEHILRFKLDEFSSVKVEEKGECVIVVRIQK